MSAEPRAPAVPSPVEAGNGIRRTGQQGGEVPSAITPGLRETPPAISPAPPAATPAPTLPPAPDTLAAAGVTITATMTRPSRPGKAPRPVWEVHAPPPFVPLLYDLGARKWGRSFSFWEDPRARITAALETYTPPTFEERKEVEKERAESRAERREEWADGHNRKAAALLKQNEPFRGDIAFNTQPGHIPERARAIRRDERAFEHHKAAQEHERRAESARWQSERDSDPGFCQRRIAEVEAEARKVRRDLAGAPAHREDGSFFLKKPEPGGEWETRLKARLQEAEERIAYYRRRMEEAGVIVFKREDFKPGDIVRGRGHAGIVKRVNPKSLTLYAHPRSPWYEPKILFAEVRQRLNPEESRAFIFRPLVTAFLGARVRSLPKVAA